MSEYTKEEFEVSYKKIYESLILDGIKQQNHCVMFLGGQPGTGKTSIVNANDAFPDYIKINGDEYRKYHPHFKDIISYDLENMPSRTQNFVNECVERLIDDLSDAGYNLIIEGTLRDPQVTINTCRTLKNKGYKTDLLIVAVDAVVSWESTINRAELQKEMCETPRLVPIDKYNYIVNNLTRSVQTIDAAGCFDRIHVINRDSKILYPDSSGRTAALVIEEQLNLGKWNELYPEIASKFIDTQVDMPQLQRKRKGR